MEDFDMVDDLFDAPTKPPTRPAPRFQPKGTKSRAKPEASGGSLRVPKKEELGIKPDIDSDSMNDAMEMDIDVKPGLRDDLMEAEPETDPEDEVVREIDVYFNRPKDPNDELYVLQYPLRPLWRPYELEDRCCEVRVKASSAELEIDLTVDTDSKNYDSSADPRLQMKKQTLKSSWKPSDTCGYAIGILKGNTLHLNPVNAVVQLRPSMQHLDSKEPKKTSNVEGAVKSEDPQEVKPAGASKKLNKVQGPNKDVEEDWIRLKYHSAKTEQASGCLKKLLAQETSQINFTMGSEDYLNSLCPGTSTDRSSSVRPPGRHLLALPLKERFKSWLLEGPPSHKFDALKYLAPDEPAEVVLEVLQECARLVQGLWFPRSPLVYREDQKTELLARDYVLLLFSKDVTIKNSQIPPGLSKAMKEVLYTLAVERQVFSDWKLKELPDTKFMKLYPSIVKKQEEEWNNLEKKINDQFQRKNVTSTKTSSKSNPANNPSSSKSSSKVDARITTGPTSVSAMTEEAREAVAKALQKLFKSVKVCRFQQIGQLLRDMAVSERNTGLAKQAVAAANSIDAYPDEFKAIVNQVAVNVHGICVPKSSPEHSQYDAFRKVVINLFLAEGPNAKLKKANILEAAKLELQRDIPNNEYNKVLGEFCTSQTGLWILNSGDGNPKL